MAFTIEGYSPEELQQLIGTDEFEPLLFTDHPVVLNAGSAEVLAQFPSKGSVFYKRDLI